MFLQTLTPMKHSMKNNLFKKFSLKTLGLPVFNKDFLLSYNNLPIDLINDDGFPIRSRRYANYIIEKDNFQNNLNIFYTGKNKFLQDVDDSRKEERIFPLIEEKFISDDFLLRFMTHCCSLDNLKDNNCYDISLHQVRQICYPNVESHNSPEGIHKDGADYIVSALVMNRYNINGGESIVYDDDNKNKNKNKIYNTILEKGEGIFQDDKRLWHYVTPITTDNNYIGIRDIIGLDIKIS